MAKSVRAGGVYRYDGWGHIDGQQVTVLRNSETGWTVPVRCHCCGQDYRADVAHLY